MAPFLWVIVAVTSAFSLGRLRTDTRWMTTHLTEPFCVQETIASEVITRCFKTVRVEEKVE